MNISGSSSIFSTNYIPSVYGAGGVTYLLDTYSAEAAYSLRQLKTGVTNVVRVRRSSDNAESDFTATEITDGTLTTWTGANDGFVVKWYNQGTEASSDVNQSTAANQPKLVSSGSVITRNSLPAIEFDGSNDRLGVIKTIDLVTNGCSFFSVSNSDAAGVNGTIFNTSTASVTVGKPQSLYINNDRRTVQKRNLIIQNTSDTNYFGDLSTGRDVSDVRLLSSFVDSSKNMSAFDNGGTGGTDTYTGTFRQDVVQLGALHVNSGAYTNHLDGTIQEFILFNTDESANRTAIETDINTHYSIY